MGLQPGKSLKRAVPLYVRKNFFKFLIRKQKAMRMPLCINIRDTKYTRYTRLCCYYYELFLFLRLSKKAE